MRRNLRAPLLALLVAGIAFSPAAAEGPGTGGRRVMLDGEPAGPYLLRVVTSPTPPRVENLYIEIRVTDAESGATITDAVVHTRAELSEDESRAVAAEATHDIAPIPSEYASHLPVTEPGVWRVTVTVDGDEGSAEVSFLTRVGGSTAVGSIIAVGLPIAGLALLAAVFLWLQRNEERTIPTEPSS